MRKESSVSAFSRLPQVVWSREKGLAGSCWHDLRLIDQNAAFQVRPGQARTECHPSSATPEVKGQRLVDVRVRHELAGQQASSHGKTTELAGQAQAAGACTPPAPAQGTRVWPACARQKHRGRSQTQWALPESRALSPRVCGAPKPWWGQSYGVSWARACAPSFVSTSHHNARPPEPGRAATGKRKAKQQDKFTYHV